MITAKPLVFACNTDAESFHDSGNELAKKFMAHVNEKYPGVPTVVLSSLLETEILQIRAEEGEEAALDYMELCGIEESKMATLLEHCSNILGL